MARNYLLPALLCLLGAGTLIVATRLNKAQISFQANPCPYNYTGPVPNPEDCFSFYLCNQGHPTLMLCPNFLCFNPSNDQCDHCNSVPGCEDEPPPPTNRTTTTTTTTTTTSTTSRPTRPPSTTTTTPRPTRPPSSTTTTTTTQRPTRPPSTTTTTEAPPNLPCPDLPYMKMPYPGDCRKYYVCVNGVNVAIESCNEGLWFHFQQQMCTYPWADTCS